MPSSDLPPLPSSGRRGERGKVLTIAAGELWCRVCGGSGVVWDGDSDSAKPKKRCIFCGSQQLVPANSCLRAGEYVTSGSAATHD